jgi:hypothetical protein
MRTIVIVLFGLFIAACSVSVSDAKRHKRPPVVTQPSAWTFFYGNPNPVMNADGVSSNWTSSPYVEADYWLKGWTTPFQPAQSIAITYRIDVLSGTPTVKSTECTSTQIGLGRAALMIGNGNDTTYYDRAWWLQTAPMTTGTHTITAPFGNGAGWTFVAGGAAGDPVQNPTNWANMLANVKKIGLTFNGCSSLGHGVYVINGSIKITIVSVVVQ